VAIFSPHNFNMKKSFFFSFIFFLVIFFSGDVATESLSIDINVNSFSVINSKSNKIILSKNFNSTFPVASTTKLVTALVAKDYLALNSIIKISSKATIRRGSHIKIEAGNKFYFKDLLRAMLVKSANNLASAIAIKVSGSEKKFAILMNRWCKRHGINRSHFSDASGLSSKNVSTAFDLIKIFKIFEQNKFLIASLKKKRFVFYSISGRKIIAKSSSQLKVFFPEIAPILVGKTGYTIRSKHCYVGKLFLKNNNYYVALLGAATAWWQLATLVDYLKDLDCKIKKLNHKKTLQ